MNIYYCDDCKAMHLVNVKDAMYFNNPEELI